MTNKNEQKPKYDFDFDSVEAKLPKKVEYLSVEEINQKISSEIFYSSTYDYATRSYLIKGDVILKNEDDVELFEDMVIDSIDDYSDNFPKEWVKHLNEGEYADCVIIDGNLIFEGNINAGTFFREYIVLGDVICNEFFRTDETFRMAIGGSIYAKYAVFDSDADSPSVFDCCEVFTPYLFTEDDGDARLGFYVPTFNDDCIITYYENVKNTFVDEVLDKDLDIDFKKLIAFIKSGKNPILEVPRTKEEIKALKKKKN